MTVMPVIHDYFEQRSAEWHSMRLGIPTASEFDRIITPAGKPSKQAPAYMYKLLAEWVLGTPLTSEYESEWMQHGREYEDVAANMFTFQTGHEVRPVGFVTRADGMVGCSPDRLLINGEPLEIKCPAPNTQVCRLLDGGCVEDEYRCQVQGEIWLCEQDRGHVVSYHPKLPMIHNVVPRDEAFIKLMSGSVESFIMELLDRREQMERRYGPFVRPEPKITQRRATVEHEFGVTVEDLEFMS